MNNGSRDPHVGREEKPVAEQHPLMDNGDGVVLFQPEGDTAILTTSSLVSWPSSPRQPRSDPGTAGVLGGRISRDAESVVEVERRALLGGAVAGSNHGHGSSATKFDYSFFALQAPRIFGFLLALVLLVFVVYMYKDKLETGGEHLLDTTQYYVHRAMETLK
eukprot:g5580.t1